MALTIMVSMAVAAPAVSAHSGQPNRHWAEHPFSTKFDYYIPYCFEDGWPNGSYGTSANNVAVGVERWNNWFVGGAEIDFRYGRMADCDDRDDEDLVVRMRDLPSGILGQFQYLCAIDCSGGHQVSGSLVVDNDTGNGHAIFYGGCCPTWQGAGDDRYHVQMIASHEAGHAAILADDFNDDQTCCEADLDPTNVNWHSSFLSDVMFHSLSTGDLHGPTTREVGWLDLSYPTVD
jgi:hypothetical protein